MSLAEFDVVIVPGGQVSEQFENLGRGGRDVIQEGVASGCGYIGICAGACLACSTDNFGLNLVPMRFMAGNAVLRDWGRVDIAAGLHGRVMIEFAAPFEVLDRSKKLRCVNGEFIGGPVFTESNHAGREGIYVMAWYLTDLWNYEIQQGALIGTPAVVEAGYGDGRVVLSGSHIELGDHALDVVSHLVDTASR